MTPTLTDYARRRLSGRTASAVVPALVVICLTGSVLISGRFSIGIDIFAAVMFVALVVILIAWVRPARPAQLTPVLWPITGSWRATMQAIQFDDVALSRPSTTNNVAMPGRVTFSQSGLTFTPTRNAAAFYRMGEQHWDTNWTLYGHRLRGFGGQMHLMMVPNNPGATPIDVWMWGGSTFPFKGRQVISGDRNTGLQRP